ncbi:MAG TPA: hypothetical protein VGC57_15605 [Cellulomonas sp.]
MNGTARTPSGAHAVTDVSQYAARVREHLVGMTAEQVDDLTDGLEADLADALADGLQDGADGAGPVDLVARFGEPADYARELRVAAGLPEPEPGPTRRPRLTRRVSDRLSRQRGRVLAWLATQSWWPGLRDFLVSVRAIWWLARAWVAFQVVLTFTGGSRGWVPTDLGRLVLLLVLVVVSVQWGRRRWLPRRAHWLPVAGSVAAVVLMLPAVITAYDQSYRYRTEVQYIDSGSATGLPAPTDGVWVDGMQVSNLFVYDAEGNPLDDVQIYDDRGRAVRTTTDNGYGSWELPGVSEPWTFVAAQDEDGRRRWNVYPLLGAPTDDFDWAASSGTGDAPTLLEGELHTPPRPFQKAPALIERDSAGVAPSAEASAPTQDESPGQSPAPTPEAGETAAP